SQARGSHPASRGYEPRPDAGPPAIPGGSTGLEPAPSPSQGGVLAVTPQSPSVSGPGGIRTHSIPRSERGWSTVLPTEPSVSSGGWNRPSAGQVQGLVSLPTATPPEGVSQESGIRTHAARLPKPVAYRLPTS